MECVSMGCTHRSAQLLHDMSAQVQRKKGYDIELVERNLQNATNLKLSMNRGCRRPYGFGHTFTCSCKLKRMIEV